MNKVLILLTNNRSNDPFLRSQLVNVYKNAPYKRMFLFCGEVGEGDELPEKFVAKKNHIESDTMLVRFFLYYLNILNTVWQHRDAEIVVHIRGFVSSFIYALLPLFFVKKITYIYDPRGAFIYGKQEKMPKLHKLIELLRVVEKRVIKGSYFTIVESKRLKAQMINLYGLPEKYVVCYNASSFSGNDEKARALQDKESLNICYCGSVNHWHDLKEIRRVFECLNNLLHDKLVKNYIYTQEANHVSVRQEFLGFKPQIEVRFVPYDNLEDHLEKMDICVSVVVPGKSTSITSPIKIADYVMLDKVIVMNRGIGDFDDYFVSQNSAIMYEFGKSLGISSADLYAIDASKNRALRASFSVGTNRSIILQKLENAHS